MSKPEIAFSDKHLLAVVCNHADWTRHAQAVAAGIQVPLWQSVQSTEITDVPYVLVYDVSGVSLVQTGRKVPGAIQAEFAAGSVNHRRHFGGGKSQLIAKAVGIKAGITKPSVLDLTAGMGKDGFVLASLGCDVTLVERNKVVYELLADGLRRAQTVARQHDEQLLEIISRMRLVESNSLRYMQSLADHYRECKKVARPDVVYLDPMFPQRTKTAQVKKEMKAFHAIVGGDADADTLIEAALQIACYRVVVKRPKKAPVLAGMTPGYELSGKTCRYDIYPLKTMKSEKSSV